MKVLGINSAFHESAAAVVVDGRVVAAVEEERFNRRKHAKPADVDNAHELPTRSIAFCLAEAGISPEDLDLVAYSFDVSLRRDTFRSDPLSNPGDWGSAAGEESFLTSLDKVPSELSSHLGIDVSRCSVGYLTTWPTRRRRTTPPTT